MFKRSHYANKFFHVRLWEIQVRVFFNRGHHFAAIRATQGRGEICFYIRLDLLRKSNT